jgi:hypothetical protein
LALLSLPDEGQGRHVVTTVSDSDLALKLIVWRVGADGRIERLGDTGNQAGWANRVRAVHVGSRIIVTSMLIRDTGDLEPYTKDRRLKLIAWRVSSDGRTVTRLGDIMAGKCFTHDLVERPYGVLSGVRTEDGLLKLIAWTVSESGVIQRRDELSLAESIQQIVFCQEPLNQPFPVLTALTVEDFLPTEPDEEAMERDELPVGRMRLVTWQD